MADPNKTWTVVGTSVQRGERSLRFANGRAADRQKVLEKAGCTEIRLHDLPRPMTREEATAWLEALGEDAPIVRLAERAAPTRREPRQLVEVHEDRPCAHEELGLAASGMSRDYWNQKPLAVRQEWSRNAAWAAGIACPRGTYPELEAWLIEDGVIVNEDGTLTERRAA
jgi:hypothetical protein